MSGILLNHQDLFPAPNHITNTHTLIYTHMLQSSHACYISMDTYIQHSSAADWAGGRLNTSLRRKKNRFQE